MKSKRFLTFINFSIISFSLSLLSSPSFAQSAKPIFDQQQCVEGLVKEGLKADHASTWCNYKQECLVRSQKEGLPADAAKSVCDCSIKEFRKRYTTDKFKELTKKADSDSKVAKELREVGESCFEGILFEQ
ncbi:hypothetical protein [Geminocystis sp. NIES-3709]|uniref:hypothetical protein n=1 Tax=Geminocystis sp. NIES-3709 TaxID=1617448 RepID=UPI0005FC6B1E|nr:hypothetical protein [Geminocystis sp. NIES-3709]BAQ63732.1 hypothetical protein GM3709_497 [Geminocystis sp. NIES-3709]